MSWYQHLSGSVLSSIREVPARDRLQQWRAANERRKQLGLTGYPLRVWRQILRDIGIARQRQRPRLKPHPRQKRLFDV